MNKAPSRDFLIQKYVIEHKAINKIAQESGYAVGTVYNYLVKYGIQRRAIGDYETSEKVIAHLRNLSEKRKGKKMSDETRKKMSESKKGKFIVNTKYGGHKKQRTDGYICVYIPSHPHANKDGYVMEHILVMEDCIGRYLTSDEVVHHINRVRNDNSLNNLKLMTFKEHAALHMNERQALKRERKMAY